MGRHSASPCAGERPGEEKESPAVLFSDKKQAFCSIKKPELKSSGFFRGADEQIRTAYLLITNEVLYRLSYISTDTMNIIDKKRERCKGFFKKSGG